MYRWIFPTLLMLTLCGCSMGGGGSGPRIDYSRTTDFKDGVLSIFVEDDLTLGTDKDLVGTAPYAPEMPGHTTGRSWTLLSRTEERTYLVYALASWNENDPGDYLAAGWWVRFEGQEFDLDADDNRYAAFLDGPDTDLNNVQSMPRVGTASYDGPMGGQFRYRYGDDWGEDKGNISLEEFAAYVTIEADFEAGTISSCIGCVGDITIRRLHLKSAFEQLLQENPLVPLKADPKDYEIHIAPVEYNPDRTFLARDPVLISVKHPERETVSISRAFWGGMFSGLRDGNDNPRLIGGFLSVRSHEKDGSSPDFVGVFNALSESFRRSGKE